jgi:hypothetical protein
VGRVVNGEKERGMMKQHARATASFDEQRLNVIQLSRDRKNEIGGYSAGLKDFAEMGPPSGEHWPLSAEQIRRAFGVPIDEDDPESEYAYILRAESHALLEQTADALKHHVPKLYGAWHQIYDPESSAERDYEWYSKTVNKAKNRMREMERQLRALPLAGRQDKQLEMRSAHASYMRHAADLALMIDRCDMFIDLLTLKLMDKELFVEFGRRMTRMQEDAGEKANAQIWDEYQELLAKKSKAESKRLIFQKYGISERTLARIEESHRLEAGLPKRAPGRPRKGEN